ncbi:hypothetical protein C8J57DRAFT_695077 [Mycena rebaudengoi]|nr:hypothetical protein C8J57DRAFT_695077 [Mycena rebaudengoi]
MFYCLLSIIVSAIASYRSKDSFSGAQFRVTFERCNDTSSFFSYRRGSNASWSLTLVLALLDLFLSPRLNSDPIDPVDRTWMREVTLAEISRPFVRIRRWTRRSILGRA